LHKKVMSTPVNIIHAELVLDAKTIIGEGPVWDHQRHVLYWIDVLGNKLFIYSPQKNKNYEIDLKQMVGTVVPRSKGVALALHHGFALLDFELDSLTDKQTVGENGFPSLKFISDPESHLTTNRFNDGKCDPAGRFWAGTMSKTIEPKMGALYRLSYQNNEFHTKKMLSDITISNGLCWSLDHKKMYYIDSPTCHVKEFNYDINTGEIDQGRICIEIGKIGLPDGMTIDTEGMLWVAIWTGSAVNRYDPNTGKLLLEVRTPANRTTAMAFGGEKLDELYITTATDNGEAAKLEPTAGGLFKVKIEGVTGVPAFYFPV